MSFWSAIANAASGLWARVSGQSGGQSAEHTDPQRQAGQTSSRLAPTVPDAGHVQPPRAPAPPPAGGPYHATYGDGTLVARKDRPPRLPVGPDPVAEGPHSRLRWDMASPARSGEGQGRIYQAREFDANGQPVVDHDFTSPTFPNGRPRPNHPPPGHTHAWVPNDPNNPRAGRRREGGE